MEPLLLKIVYLFLVASHVAGAVDYHVYKDTDGDEVLDVPVYPANTTSRPTQKRSTTDSPMCSLNYGLAHVQEAPVNIQHLKDVENVTCAVPVDSCARVSNSNLSSIFVCNYVSTQVAIALTETNCNSNNMAGFYIDPHKVRESSGACGKGLQRLQDLRLLQLWLCRADNPRWHRHIYVLPSPGRRVPQFGLGSSPDRATNAVNLPCVLA
ncbi:hypothetical protein M747DRAFT_250233 [Aspergillus niger ATCC 13496]|uniref:Uncharacterized protein n=3 Tax=Aspergillus niger TaxID=5061 RepID=A2QSP8_ASPNC|nr:hypothetical protein An08g11500 [Aspergillus niger]RDH14121.1 hypothetical protein M747DRAFT_250233 [Aspergillus niger ATCC 13496]CAK45820.1 hypothetical protein An08g11500 [Aspergillus niger]